MSKKSLRLVAGLLTVIPACHRADSALPESMGTVVQLDDAQFSEFDSETASGTNVIVVVAGGTVALQLPSEFFIDIRLRPEGGRELQDEVEPKRGTGVLAESKVTNFAFDCVPGGYRLHVVIGRIFENHAKMVEDIKGQEVVIRVGEDRRKNAFLVKLDEKQVRGAVDRLAQTTCIDIRPTIMKAMEANAGG